MISRRLFVFSPPCLFLLNAADPLSGKWEMTMDTPGGERKAAPTLILNGEKVTGKWDNAEVQGTFKENRLELDFPLTSNEAGSTAQFKISAKLEGTTLTGTWSWSTYDGRLTGKRQ